MTDKILGYKPTGAPIHPTKPGMVYTACIVSCVECRAVIRGMGGPIQDALCVPCWEKKTQCSTCTTQLTALREELAELEDEFDTLEHTNITLKQRLADAERRNASYAELLLESRKNLNLHAMEYKHPGQHGLIAKIDAAINPNPEATD
jgi:hypothetical protein